MFFLRKIFFIKLISDYAMTKIGFFIFTSLK